MTVPAQGKADADATTAWAMAGDLTGAEDLRVGDRARGLVLTVGAELPRIDAALAVARQRLATTAAARRARRLASIAVLEHARALIINAGAHRSQRRRDRLIARLGGGPVKPYRQGLTHRHSWPRTALRRLNPRWWMARRHTWDGISVEHRRPAGTGIGGHKIILRRGGLEIGTASCTACAVCKVACVDEIDIEPNYEGRGLGTGVLERLRVEVPGYRWCTTPQRETARSFWRRLQRSYPGEYFGLTDTLRGPCPHLAARYY